MKPELIVALDVPDWRRATKLIDRLIGDIRYFKVGSQLFTLCGPRIVRYIRARGGEVFLDLKYHDIPNTVANAVRAAAELGVAMLTVHAQGGREMLRAAVSAAKAPRRERRPLRVLAVTVLTSQASADTDKEVVRRARLAREAGCHGVVASALECGRLRQMLGDRCIIVTPGIRPSGADAGDQKRVATVSEAVRAGSDYLVVGRPIVEAADPVREARAMANELSQAHKRRKYPR
ncbi:MAG: orotidine-5'-phosphate decarboxylase [Deltaproteobacteria bacterium]